jgi:hypothetical protein
MKWTVVSCSCCNEGVLVPPDVGDRVAHGVTNILCEACIENVNDPGRG